jgi:hypothetical protein
VCEFALESARPSPKQLFPCHQRFARVLNPGLLNLLDELGNTRKILRLQPPRARLQDRQIMRIAKLRDEPAGPLLERPEFAGLQRRKHAQRIAQVFDLPAPFMQ